MLGMDIRYVVTSLTGGSAEHIYDSRYCARGQAENLIKVNNSQLASDRTSCHNRRYDGARPANAASAGSPKNRPNAAPPLIRWVSDCERQ